MKNERVKKIAVSAILTAMAIVLKTYVSIPIGIQARTLSIWPIPIILVGIICGLKFGLASGLITDIIYFFLFGGVYNPFYTISAIAWGLCGYLIKISKKPHLMVFVYIAIFSIFETANNTLGMIVYQQDVIANLWFRIVNMIIRIPILGAIIFVLKTKVIDIKKNND